MSVLYNVPLRQLIAQVTGFLPIYHCFQLEEAFILGKKAILLKFREIFNPYNKPSNYNLVCCIQCFPLRTQWACVGASSGTMPV
jgi:hypothetical protein